ncbi:MAG TPA: tetratricopeptide repeat protein [Croceibacterium sp.]|nr:tetratricopeptide repeat protein [Croceibacterium sp.]
MALTPDSGQTREQQLALRKAAEQEALLREVDEAVRQDQVGTFAKRYGWALGGGLVLALAAFGGWLFWSDHREGQLEAKSETLVKALDQIDAGQVAEADAGLEALAADGSSATAVSAKLARAGIALRDNRRDEALALYEGIAADGDAPQAYRDLATVRVVAARFDELPPQQVVDRLKPLATPGNPWFGSAGEMVGMAYVAQGKDNLAGPLFAAIAKDETVPRTLRSRTRQLAGLLGYDAVVDVDQTLAEMREETASANAPVPVAAQ